VFLSIGKRKEGIHDVPIEIQQMFLVKAQYSEGGKVFNLAIFPSLELAQAYLRYLKELVSTSKVMTAEIEEVTYYDINFEVAHKLFAREGRVK
jgi:hypothetical protein